MHSYPLEEIIKEKIRREGPISFETFMDMALYHPERGYYASRPSRWGPGGDYYTAPRLHSVFGSLLAVQLDEMRSRIDAPDGFTLLEPGGGEGHLARAAIACIEQQLHWQGDWQYVLIEKNPRAVDRQRALLGPAARRVVWKASLDQVDPFTGCILSNEVLDAFPVHRVGMQDRFREIYVSLSRDRFTEQFGELGSPELAEAIAKYRIPALRGYRTEINLAIKRFLLQAQRLLQEGFLITIDYGYPARQYYAVERSEGTLVCYHRHTVNRNPYQRIGGQDITAHVNFTSLKDWGQEVGLHPLGYSSQGSFLASILAAVGSEAALERRFDPALMTPADRLKIKNLLLDIGATHRVMVHYKGPRKVAKLTGFAMSNRLQSL